MMSVVLWLSLACQLGAAWISLRLARRLSRPGWLALAFAMLFMSIRRLYLIYTYYTEQFNSDLTNELNGLLNAGLLLVGWWMLWLMLTGPDRPREPSAARARPAEAGPASAAAPGGGLARAALVMGVLSVLGCIAAGLTAHFAIVGQLEVELAAHPHPAAAQAAAGAVLPWGLVFLFITLIFFPLALWLLHGAYAASRRDILAAHEQVRLLNRDLDRRVAELQALFDTAPVGIAVALDPACKQITLNAAAAAMLGTPRDANVSKTGAAADTLPFTVMRNGREVAPDELPMQQAAASGKPVRELELEIVHRDGWRRTLLEYAAPLFDESGRVRGAMGVWVDLTGQRRVEEARRQSESRFRGYFELGLVGMAITSPDKGWIEVNDRFCQMLGRTREQLTGTTWAQLTHPDDLAADEARFNRVIAGEMDGYAMDKRFIRADGTVIHVSMAVRCVRNAAGGVEYFLASLQDITNRRATEDALRASEEHHRQAAQTNRRLLTEVNHRVRNNLAALMSLIVLTRRKSASLDAFADAMRARLAAMTQVHNLLADVAYREIDLRELVDNLFASAQLAAQHAVALRLEGPPALIPPRLTVPLAMALQELFTNSLKYGSFSVAGGVVRVAWTTRPAAQGVEVNLAWEESGGPAVIPPASSSLGTDLIEGFVTFELGGRCRLTYPPQGVHHTLVFVLPDANGAGPDSEPQAVPDAKSGS